MKRFSLGIILGVLALATVALAQQYTTSTGTATLSNKTFTAPIIQGGFTMKGGTSGTQPFAVPSAVGTPAALIFPTVAAGDTLVAKTTTDTLTNKTLIAPAISAPVIGGITSTVQNKSSYQVLTSASAATPVNAALGDNCFAALTENTTIGAPTNPVDGQILTFKFTNTASNRTVAFDTIFHCVAGLCPTITTGVKDSMIAFKYDATGTVWNELYRALNE
jgi:hypothetical protein